MRGKLYFYMVHGGGIGITPADAGKTSDESVTIEEYKDHPRGCGENSAIRAEEYTMWGITPADAGKTLKRSFRNQPFCS